MLLPQQVSWCLIRLSVVELQVLLLYYSILFKIPVGIGYFLVNILLLIIAMKVLGPKFGIKTIFAIIVGSVFLGIMQPLMPVDGILPDEKFMSTIIAAMLTGIGIGVSLSVGGSTGGTDIIAMLVTKYHNVSPGAGIDGM